TTPRPGAMAAALDSITLLQAWGARQLRTIAAPATAWARAVRERIAVWLVAVGRQRRAGSATVVRVVSAAREAALEAENAELRAVCTETQIALQREIGERLALVQLAPFASHAAFLRRCRPSSLHLNGCGDFQLAARRHWFELHGYPELETFSM